MQFERLTLEHRAAFEAAVKNAPDTRGWEYCFAVLWLWNAYDNARVCVEDGIFYVYTVVGDKLVFYPPYCSADRVQEALDKIEAYCLSQGHPFFVRGVSEALLTGVDKARYAVEPVRDEFDYIYAAEDLATLKGKKFHSKRNYVTRFMSRYPDYVFRAFEDGDGAKLLALYDKWNSRVEHQTLLTERHAIARAFQYQKQLGLFIYVLETGGETVGFSVCAPAPDGVMHNLFEKGDVSYDGVYQAVNKLTAEACFQGYRYVNRQEDMGIEGLRKAKLSYNPVLLQTKYTVRRK